MSGQVFISYSHKDGDYVDRLAAALTDAGIDVWTDRGIRHGDGWARTIERQLRGCAVFVPVMSPASREADWVAREILLALDLRKPILPLLLDGDRFMELLDKQDEDVRGGALPSERFVARIHELTRTAVTDHAAPSNAGVGKYRPLTEWLLAQTVDEIPVAFADLERIIGQSLAPSARNHRPYWYSTSNSLGKAIAAGEFKASAVDLAAETLVLRRSTTIKQRSNAGAAR